MFHYFNTNCNVLDARYTYTMYFLLFSSTNYTNSKKINNITYHCITSYITDIIVLYIFEPIYSECIFIDKYTCLFLKFYSINNVNYAKCAYLLIKAYSKYGS